ncbi:hypothetical protein ACP70R_001480 [Stipagrostis hirtigluma subsp. patula]
MAPHHRAPPTPPPSRSPLLLLHLLLLPTAQISSREGHSDLHRRSACGRTAGLLLPTGSVMDMDLGALDRVMAVNFCGAGRRSGQVEACGLWPCHHTGPATRPDAEAAGRDGSSTAAWVRTR